MANWYEDRSNLHALASILLDTDALDNDELLHFIEKPWKWSNYWEAIEELVNDNNNSQHEEKIFEIVESIYENS